MRMKKVKENKIKKFILENKRQLWIWCPVTLIILLLILGISLKLEFINNFTMIVLVAVTALYAVFTQEQAMATNKMVEEIKLQRKGQIMPQVMVYLDNPVSILFELVVKNVGQGAAKDITLKITPPLFDHMNRDISGLSLFKNGISFLPPGAELRQVVDTSEKFFKGDGKFPLDYEITISYSDVEGNILSQNIPINIEVYRNLKTRRESDVEKLAEQVKSLVQVLNKKKDGYF